MNLLTSLEAKGVKSLFSLTTEKKKYLFLGIGQRVLAILNLESTPGAVSSALTHIKLKKQTHYFLG